MLSTVDELTDELRVEAGEDGWKTELVLRVNRIGLSLHKLVLRSDQAGLQRDVLCAPEESHALQTEGRKFLNPVVGRYANRLPAGHHVPVQDISLPNRPPIELNLENNEPSPTIPGKWNCLHSGSHGYDLREFERVSEDSPIVEAFRSLANTDQESQSNRDGQVKERAYYHLHSPSGDQGFPEPVDILATITLEILTSSAAPDGLEKRDLNLIGRARFDLKAKIATPIDGYHHQIGVAGTPINLTWHNGYILNDFKALKPDQPGIYQHKLWIDTKNYLETDESQLATGEIKSISALGVDFSSKSEDEIKRIHQTMPSSGFDQCFLFERSARTSGAEAECKVVLTSPKDDLRMKFYSNQDSVQCYSANFFDGLGTRKELHATSEHHAGYNKHESIYLEFQQPPSVCTNANLQRNLRHFFGRQAPDDDDSDCDGDRAMIDQTGFCGYTTVLYPHQVYQNWFSIDFLA